MDAVVGMKLCVCVLYTQDEEKSQSSSKSDKKKAAMPSLTIGR